MSLILQLSYKTYHGFSLWGQSIFQKISIKVCFSILRFSSDNSFTLVSSFEANGLENLKRHECYLGDGERRYRAVVEGKAKNTTQHSSEKATDCRAHWEQFYHVKILFHILLNLILLYWQKAFERFYLFWLSLKMKKESLLLLRVRADEAIFKPRPQPTNLLRVSHSPKFISFQVNAWNLLSRYISNIHFQFFF